MGNSFEYYIKYQNRDFKRNLFKLKLYHKEFEYEAFKYVVDYNIQMKKLRQFLERIHLRWIYR